MDRSDASAWQCRSGTAWRKGCDQRPTKANSVESADCPVVACPLLVPYCGRFEIDIVEALSSQLIVALEKLEIGPMSVTEISSLQPGQGVYQLFHRKALVYVGQADSLKKRLLEHYKKISGRKNIDVSELGF